MSTGEPGIPIGRLVALTGVSEGTLRMWERRHGFPVPERLSRELDSMRAQLAESDSRTSELSTLREEREIIRTRVTDMLDQLEALNL